MQQFRRPLGLFFYTLEMETRKGETIDPALIDVIENNHNKYRENRVVCQQDETPSHYALPVLNYLIETLSKN